MAETWRIARRSRTCAQSGAAIHPGEAFFSALVETDDDFNRLDFSLAAWPEVDKGGFFSYWKNKASADAGGDKRQPIDYDRLIAFFDSLEGAADPGKRLFRYVLALVLVRRRALRLDDMTKIGEEDTLVVHDRRGDRTLTISAPQATREQLAMVQDKLNRLFDCDFEPDEAPR